MSVAENNHSMCKAGCGKPAKRYRKNNNFARTCGDTQCRIKLMKNAGIKRAMERAEMAANRVINPSEPVMHFEDAEVEERLITRLDHPSHSPGVGSSANL
jgi:hypothetical protein